MEDYLHKKYLYLPLSQKSKKSTSMTNAKWDIIDRRALVTIWLCMGMFATFKIPKEMTTKGLMKALVKLYEKPSTSNKIFLMKCLFNMKMLEGGFIADNLNEFKMSVYTELKNVLAEGFESINIDIEC